MATYYSSLSDQRDFLTAPYQQHAKTPPENEPEPPHHLHGNMMYLNQHSQFLDRSSSSVHEGVETQEGMGFSENSQMGLRSSVHAMGSCEQNLMNQGLSLSLGTQIPSTVDDHSSFQYQYAAQDAYSNSHVYEPTGFVNDILSSRYLKAAQELLDEVVSVKNALKKPDAAEKNKKSSEFSRNMDGTSSDLQESTTVSSSEISQLERKDLQNKLGNLLSMLDEVDKKYRQYYHQMQIVVSSFEMVAGRGAAKAYTSLALQTISRHFRSLRDAITSQIQATKKTLGEEDATPTGQERLPRLRYVDHQLRQQRSLQQFGVMRHSWRPQRGLPENSVSILRAWLFEHFLHPYPKDSEKIMLARQTGLSRGQVANWFINARVRLWKPMIEEMYNEEFAELNSKSPPDEALKEERDKPWQSEHTKEEIQEPEAEEGAGNFAKYDDSKSNYVPEVGMQGCTAMLDFANSGCRDNQNTYDPNDIPGNHAGEFSVGEQVSLALGLQECENSQMTMPSGVQFRGKATSHSVLGNNAQDYYFMDLLSLNQHHRMADPQMSPDFVA